MATVSTSLPSDGQTIDASDVNTPINAILSEFNGNIDDNNIKTGANINGSKLLAASLSGSKFDASTAGGWITGGLPAVSSVTDNGNRSADITFASTVASILTPGMRLRTSRTVAAPTQSTSLNGSTQYYSKSSPNKLTFTDDFVVSAWVKLTSYQAGTIASRYNGTSGWQFYVVASGQLVLAGYNGGASNNSYVQSYQSIPLNKWVHVAAQLDMSSFTASTTTSYIMIDGVDVPASVTRGGTNPTALVQAGNLEIGAGNATQFWAGKFDQVAIYNAKVAQATIRASKNQGLAGTETSLASAYSFNNSIADLNTTTPNDLTAQGGALATNADSPFTVDANGVPHGTYDWGIVTKVAAAVATVQYPEGCTIPTTGGISTVDYSGVKAPLGMPVSRQRFAIEVLYNARIVKASPVTTTSYNNGEQITAPTGSFSVTAKLLGYVLTSGSTTINFRADLSTASASTSTSSKYILPAYSSGLAEVSFPLTLPETNITSTGSTVYYLNVYATFGGTGTSLGFLHDFGPGIITLVPDSL